MATDPSAVQAFGLRVHGTLAAPGLNAAAANGRPTRGLALDVVEPGAPAAAWPADAALVHERRSPESGLALRVERHDERGWAVRLPGWAQLLVSPDGDRIVAEPAARPAWEWQRLLVAQALPLAAVLQGLEVLHAAAVVVDGEAVALVGHSGTGKSTLAARLVLDGAAFLADDVLAVNTAGAAVIAHPGPGLATMRASTAAELGPDAVARLGTVVGEADGELRLAVEPAGAPAVLRHMYFIEWVTAADQVVQPVEQPPPSALLAAVFNPFVQTPARMATQLGVLAAIGRSVRIVRLAVPPEVDAEALAALVAADVRGAR